MNEDESVVLANEELELVNDTNTNNAKLDQGISTIMLWWLLLLVVVVVMLPLGISKPHNANDCYPTNKQKQPHYGSMFSQKTTVPTTTLYIHNNCNPNP